MPLIMSVSGVRGTIGDSLTPTVATELAAAFGAMLRGGKVVLGRDSRPSGEWIKAAVESGLLATGCDVIDLGIVTTPGAAVMVNQRQADGGIMITASHNPIEWNGLKFLTAFASAPTAGDAQRIFDRYRMRQFNYVVVQNIGTLDRDFSTNDVHVARVLRLCDLPAIRRRQLVAVLDSVNGAGGPAGRTLLEQFGCRVIHLNAEPTGKFTHPPEPVKENLTTLCAAVREHRADIGFAQDPDADRLAIVDETGRFIGEEYTLALAARHLFSRHTGPVAANLSTSRMIDDLAAAAGARVFRSAVGEANVVAAMRENDCVFGGEGNGGVIDPRVVYVRDSLSSMGLVVGLMAQDWRPLSAIVDELPRYVMIKQKSEMPRDAIDAWLDRVRVTFSHEKLNDADGIRIDWPEGWVHVRSSNTEPIARVIAEAADEATAQSLARRILDLR